MPWVSFDRMREATPTCGPSRAAILTGRRSDHTGATSNATTYMQLPWDETFNHWLPADVHKEWYGKVMNGWNGTATPETSTKFAPPGWDYIWGLLEDTNQYTGVVAHHMYADGTWAVQDPPLSFYGNTPEGYTTDVISTKLQAFIAARAADGERGLCKTDPFSPHEPFTQAARHNSTGVAPIPLRPSWLTNVVPMGVAWIAALNELSSAAYTTATTTSITKARRTCLATDDMIDAACAALIAAGLYDQTDIVFWTDNGNDFCRYKRLTSATSNAKSNPYPNVTNASCLYKPADGAPHLVILFELDDMPHGWHLEVPSTGVNVPFPKLAARMAAEGSTAIPQPCSTVDLTATICARFDVDPPAGIVLDGRDMTPLLLGLDVPWPDAAESCVRHNDANTSIWWSVNDDAGNIYVEHYPSVAASGAGASPSYVELYPDGETTDCLVNEADNPAQAALQAEMAAQLAALKAQSHGQALDAGRPYTSAGVKSKWRVVYGGVPVEARGRVA